MITLKCPSCGKKIIWDDFQPTTIKCPKCGETITVRQGLKDNIRIREKDSPDETFKCPRCNAPIKRRWFIKCSECGYWIFGRFSINGIWLFIGAILIGYSILSYYYISVIH